VSWQSQASKAIKRAIKSDSRLMLRLALCDKLGMTPSQLAQNATKDDIIMLAAYYEIQADLVSDPNPATPQPRRSRRR